MPTKKAPASKKTKASKAKASAKKAKFFPSGKGPAVALKRAPRRALCVGINDYPYDGSDLNGCVNDARAWGELLVSQYGFAGSDVRVMTDAEATKKNVMAALKDLLAGAREGD